MLSAKKVTIRKRIVLHHATGRFAGLRQILGVLEGRQANEDMPTSLSYGRSQTANHSKTKPRYIEYREWAQAPRGRLNDFNPAQV